MARTKALGQERTHCLWGSLRNCYMATGVLEKKVGACALQGFGGSSILYPVWKFKDRSQWGVITWGVCVMRYKVYLGELLKTETGNWGPVLKHMNWFRQKRETVVQAGWRGWMWGASTQNWPGLDMTSEGERCLGFLGNWGEAWASYWDGRDWRRGWALPLGEGRAVLKLPFEHDTLEPVR